jgi:hypothetical protein
MSTQIRRFAVLASMLLSTTVTFGQPLPPPLPPATGWPQPLPTSAGQPPAPPVPSGLPERFETVYEPPPSAPGQQHWIALNLVGGQPSVARIGVKIWPRENNSLWIEAYTGSALWDYMYGFGFRVQHTAWGFTNGDSIFVSPGLGLQVLPDWYADLGRYNHRGRWVPGDSHYSSLFFLAGDIDVSWVHDFSPRFGFELGLKFGLAGRVGGTIGDCYPRNLMWGNSVMPILGAYTGMRF